MASTDIPVRHLAWCGLHTIVPDTFRPFKITGNQQRGAINLGADGQPRLMIRWTTTTARRPRRMEKLVRKQLLRGWTRRRIRQLRPKIQPIENSNFESMLTVTDDDNAFTRCAAFAPATNRLIDLMYYHGPPREDAVVRRRTFDALVDQPPDQPQRWAFFDVSFIAPPGMQYESSKLNIGDMRIALAGASARGRGGGRGRGRGRGRVRGRRAKINLRQVYPADLALNRLPLDRWLDHALEERRREYRPTRKMRRRDRQYPPLSTTLGDGLSCDTFLRPGLRLMRWRTPRCTRTWLIHDVEHHRLIVLEAADHVDQLQTTLSAMVDGLHWTQDMGNF